MMMVMFSIITQENGQPLTMDELFRMDEEFDNNLLKKYSSEELKLLLYYLERRRNFRESYRGKREKAEK